MQAQLFSCLHIVLANTCIHMYKHVFLGWVRPIICYIILDVPKFIVGKICHNRKVWLGSHHDWYPFIDIWSVFQTIDLQMGIYKRKKEVPYSIKARKRERTHNTKTFKTKNIVCLRFSWPLYDMVSYSLGFFLDFVHGFFYSLAFPFFLFSYMVTFLLRFSYIFRVVSCVLF